MNDPPQVGPGMSTGRTPGHPDDDAGDARDDADRPWRRWADPHASVEDTELRRRIKVAVYLVLALMALSFFFFLYARLGLADDPTRLTWLTVGLITAELAAYGLLRSPWPRAGILVVVMAPWIGLYAMWTASADAVDPLLLFYGSVPLILAGLLFSPFHAALFIGANLVATAWLLLGPETTGFAISREVVTDGFLFMATVASLAMVGSVVQARMAHRLEAANDQLMRLDRERLDLLNVIAHDLASPLTPMVLQTDLLERELGENKRVAMIRRNVVHLQRLIGDVRDLSKLESGRLALDPRPVDLKELVHDTVDGVREAAEAQGVEPSVDAEDPLPVHADPDRINQVLLNLLTNALKFTPPGGRVRIDAGRLDGHARVTVADEGRGLAPDEIPRLFRPFSQVHDRAEVEEKGTGLGLFISKGIIERHGGRIWVESRGLGHGATFGFELPLMPGSHQEDDASGPLGS